MILPDGRIFNGTFKDDALIGATTEAVIRKTGRSTVVVPSGAPVSGPIVLGFDGSPGSRIAAKTAVEVANGLGEAVHVFVDSKPPLYPLRVASDKMF